MGNEVREGVNTQVKVPSGGEEGATAAEFVT